MKAKWVFAGLLLAFTIYTGQSLTGGFFVKKLNNTFEVHRVAHAGGAIEGRTLTNSIEALNASYALGFRYFELDFEFTSDGNLVCIHDWEQTFNATFGFSLIKIPTLLEFRQLVSNSAGFHNCTLQSLVSWMTEHPESRLVTDIKSSNLAGLQMIMDELPGAAYRVIPQIYQPGNFRQVREMGFKSIIWTLYRFGGIEKDVIEWVTQFEPPFAITMPERWADSALPKHLARRNIPTYVHTLNSEEKLAYYRDKGITEIYTDFLSLRNIGDK